jgi:signal transduction histidine kinase
MIWAETSLGVDRLIHGRFVAAAAIQDFVFGEDRLGRVFAFTRSGTTVRIRENGLVDVKGAPQISRMVESVKNTWFCGDGIYRVSPGSLENWERQPDAPRDYTRFGRLDGMNSAECSGGFPNLALAKDGNLWAATNQGLAMLDVSRIALGNRKPVVYLEKVVLEKTVRPAGRELIVPPGTHHIELHFDAIELAAPERIRLQYRLDDVDSEWLDADSSASAVYSGFPNGTHKFHVRACNGSGVWDLEGVDYIITQKPYYFETNIFRLAVAVAVVLFLAAAYNLRLRRLKGQMNARLNERVMERTQVARELHDTLLQTIQASKMVADDALDQPADLHLRKALERLSIWLGQAIQEGRAALGALRASTTQTNNLASALRQACADCVVSGQMTSTVTVNGAVREIHPIVLDDIQRIAFEAIRNACAHSRATELNVEVRYGPDLELRVRDNGIGLDPELLITGKDRHFGLQGMQERADRIGAKLRFHAKTPGTEVDLFVPRSVAYYEKKLDSKG